MNWYKYTLGKYKICPKGSEDVQVTNRITSSKTTAELLNIDELENWMNKTLSTGIGAMKVWMLLNLVIWLEEIDNF